MKVSKNSIMLIEKTLASSPMDYERGFSYEDSYSLDAPTLFPAGSMIGEEFPEPNPIVFPRLAIRQG